ncbi:hypothetical protein BDV96DRAFT_580408 [Lophiotrema nucula]|uniref:Uncharacterized protein n=1 Tax=Lophiotrema nucula TaxID=690887 RepID=A0A6A5Z1P2_9PLEO|nr:hypothetical protein BDV96DRAFT_580408 [Lophiotrema nucula]
MKNVLELETKRYFAASAIKSIWTDLERAYILDTDAQRGSCERDRQGPTDLRICLDERPGRSYWIYTIDHSEENNLFTENYAVKVPP